MRTRPAQAEPGEGQLATLLEEVSQLRDLFQRRLFEDKAKNRLYEELYAQLTVARDGLTQQIVTPLFRELLLVVDRVNAVNKHRDVVLESIAGELLELLERRDVRRVHGAGVFDPAIHEAARTEPRADQPPGTVLEVLRPGYLLGGRLLRPERVVVATAASEPAAGIAAMESEGAESAEPCRP